MSTSSLPELELPERPETPDAFGAHPRLTEEQIMLLSRFGDRRQFPRGTMLFCEGDRDCDFFVVLEGKVAVVQETDGALQLIAVHGRHRFLGDVSMLTGQTAFSTAVAQEDVEVLAVPFDKLKEAVAESPSLGDLILRALLLRRSVQSGVGGGLQIIGSRSSAESRRLRDFVSRNPIPHRWIDLEEDKEAEAILLRLNVTPDETPVVTWKGRNVLRNPSNVELASVIGLRAVPERGAYDMAVVGAGPAGLAAAVYGASEGLSTVVLDAVATGGQAATSTQIENYLGFPAGISGAELADRAVVQARKFGASFSVPGEARSLDLVDGYNVVRHDDLYRDMSRYLADRVSRTPRIQVWRNCEVTELVGSATLAGVVVRDLSSGEERPLESTALFVLIGSTPQTAWLQGQISLDEKGFVRTGSARRAGAGMFRPTVLACSRSGTCAAVR